LLHIIFGSSKQKTALRPSSTLVKARAKRVICFEIQVFFGMLSERKLERKEGVYPRRLEPLQTILDYPAKRRQA
jgi:hypothetical protein